MDIVPCGDDIVHNYRSHFGSAHESGVGLGEGITHDILMDSPIGVSSMMRDM